MQYGIMIKNKCPREKIDKRTKRSILRTEICGITKQQPNYIKFGIIIYALMCNLHTKFGLYSLHRMLVAIDRSKSIVRHNNGQ